MAATGSLDGRVAIVTGGARGIGAAICEELYARGASVVVADNGVEIDGRSADPSVAEEFADRLGERARPYTKDMSVPVASKEVVQLALDQFGAIDIVVNNAAILRDAFIFKGSPDDWDTVIRTNLSAAYYLLSAATPIMREQARTGRGGEGETPTYRWGRIVNIVSSVAYFGNYGQASYAAAKGGLTSLSRSVALDMARSGVTCNALVPFAHTRVTESIKPTNDTQTAYKERMLKIPVSYVAGMTGYLCSEAAQGITGQILGVRGKEIFVFCQPRPVARVVDPGAEWDDAFISRAIEREMKDKLEDLVTDVELYNTDPVV